MILARRWPLHAAGPDDGDLVLDLTRFLGRVYHAAPTGIDRVEMAWATGLLARVPERLAFAALHPAGGYYGRLPTGAVRRLLDWTQERWADGSGGGRGEAVRHLWALRPRPVPARRPRVCLFASPVGLEDARLAAARMRAEDGRMVCLLHDLIPVTHPEYARAGGAGVHRRRLETVGALAEGVVANSAATLAAAGPWLGAVGVTRAAVLGTDRPVPADGPMPAGPYFVCAATIEPRKNHLLLLNAWRRMAEEGGEVPTLVLVGRRGWENENAVDMIERAPALRGHVVEAGAVGDGTLARLVAGARAVLLPSFAEGYGMPVAEALAAGVPVLCSDLPALREAGGGVPDYLDPLDGPGWIAAIRDYARAGSPGRATQLARMAGWAPVPWDRHLDAVLAVADAVAAAQAPPRWTTMPNEVDT